MCRLRSERVAGVGAKMLTRLIAAWALALFLPACANLQSDKSADKNDKDAVGSEIASADRGDKRNESLIDRASDDEDEEGAKDGSKEPRIADIENYTIGQVIRSEEPNTQSLYDNSRYDFPITMNSRVEGWIDYFTGRGRYHMDRYLARASRYIPMMKETLKKQGMPEDLVYLALIESGFNLRAKSRARAVGAWQFMKATGKRYGLRVDAWIDERRDPIKSTEAAARYLKDLYLMFESWYLAASAYNAGEYKILRAIEELKTNNYWRICETRFLRRETKDYVPKLIAAAIIAKNPARYGFEDIEGLEPLKFESVTVNFPVHLREIAKLVDADLDDIEELNPHLVRTMVPPNVDSYEIRVPPGSRVLVERAIAKIRNQLESSEIPREHVVRSGETLGSIAKRYKVRVKDLANTNNLSPKEKVTPGLALIVPGGKATREEARREKVAVSKADKPPRKSASDDADFITHTVRRGESLWSISEKYDVTVQEIFRWNGLKRSRIFPGRKLRIKSRAEEESSAHHAHNRRVRKS